MKRIETPSKQSRDAYITSSETEETANERGGANVFPPISLIQEILTEQPNSIEGFLKRVASIV